MKISYERYRLSALQIAGTLFSGAALFCLMDFLLYRSLYLLFLLPPFLYICLRRREKKEAGKRSRELREAFLPGIRAFVVALRAGYSAPSALPAALADLRVRYPADHILLREMNAMQRGLSVGMTLPELFEDLGRRSGITEIRDFAGIFAVGSRMGGAMTELLWESADQLEKRLELEKELEAAQAARVAEQRVMNLVPAVMLLYLEAASPSYMAVYFQTAAGRIVMTVCLLIFAAAWFWSEKISEIHV